MSDSTPMETGQAGQAASQEKKRPPLERSMSEETAPRPNRTRGTSIGDARWRTQSFSEPGRVILLAVDLSENCKVAFEYYLRNIHRHDDLIVITHVPEPPKLPSFSFKEGLKVPSARWKEILDDANTKTSKLLNDYEDTCLHRKLRYKIRGECYKNAGEMVCHIADEEGADLIVMGTRGHGHLKRAALGSTSDYVVRHAARPTIIIPRHD